MTDINNNVLKDNPESNRLNNSDLGRITDDDFGHVIDFDRELSEEFVLAFKDKPFISYAKEYNFKRIDYDAALEIFDDGYIILEKKSNGEIVIKGLLLIVIDSFQYSFKIEFIYGDDETKKRLIDAVIKYYKDLDYQFCTYFAFVNERQFFENNHFVTAVDIRKKWSDDIGLIFMIRSF